MAFLQCGIILLALLSIWHRKKESEFVWEINPLDSLVLLFYAFCWISLLQAPNPYLAVLPLLHYVAAIVFYFVAANGFAQTTPAPQATPAPQTTPAPAEKSKGGMSKGAKIASISGIAAAAVAGSIAIAKSGPDKKSSTVSFASMDTNNDGAVSSAGFKAGMTGVFKAADGNGDGSLSRDEDIAAFPNKGAGYFDLIDVQKSGAVSAAAFSDAAMKVFTAVDTNADGSISAAERDAAKTKAPATN